ncbi:hypothetical protein AWB76_03284 [Caballeronia temeraria]|uniref:Uncharacterized protein n=1 Tax=Caballeronia temeraria TaxID=1777137 RepID=A0A158B041_9BURK|nr:hypothetical protein [Caballeronia temeraria]SAK62637.1 hypothetical protein AWB76_03284 [Caballeronia temeraria]
MSGLVDRVSLDVFLPFVMAGARGLPESMALAYIRQACIEFAQRSNILRRRAFIDMQCGVTDYPVWPDDCEEIARINAVRVGLTTYRGTRDTIDLCHCGSRFTVRDGLLHLPTPPHGDQPRAVEVRFCAKPAQTACEVDAILHSDWQDAIEDGALARIYQLPGYEFTQPMLATTRARSFYEKIARARVRALKSDTSATPFAVAPSFI